MKRFILPIMASILLSSCSIFSGASNSSHDPQTRDFLNGLEAMFLQGKENSLDFFETYGDDHSKDGESFGFTSVLSFGYVENDNYTPSFSYERLQLNGKPSTFAELHVYNNFDDPLKSYADGAYMNIESRDKNYYLSLGEMYFEKSDIMDLFDLREELELDTYKILHGGTKGEAFQSTLDVIDLIRTNPSKTKFSNESKALIKNFDKEFFLRNFIIDGTIQGEPFKITNSIDATFQSSYYINGKRAKEITLEYNGVRISLKLPWVSLIDISEYESLGYEYVVKQRFHLIKRGDFLNYSYSIQFAKDWRNNAENDDIDVPSVFSFESRTTPDYYKAFNLTLAEEYQGISAHTYGHFNDNSMLMYQAYEKGEEAEVHEESVEPDKDGKYKHFESFSGSFSGREDVRNESLINESDALSLIRMTRKYFGQGVLLEFIAPATGESNVIGPNAFLEKAIAFMDENDHPIRLLYAISDFDGSYFEIDVTFKDDFIIKTVMRADGQTVAWFETEY